MAENKDFGSLRTTAAARWLNGGIGQDEGGVVYTESPALNSPLTSLALNLGELNASLDGTPKRRISWNSVESTSPIECRSHQLLDLNKDDGFYDSPLSQRPFKEVSSALNAPVLRKLFPQSGSQVSKSASPLPVFGKENFLPGWPSPVKEPREDDDGSSRDSGFSDKELTKFHFMEPKGLAPRRQRTSSSDQFSAALGRNPSLQDVEFDDGFQDIPDPSSQDVVSTMPCGFSKLIDGKLPPISPSASDVRSPLREFDDRVIGEEYVDNRSKGKGCNRNLSFVDGWAKEGDGRTGEWDRKLGFKRPDPPRDLHSPLQNKRRKSLSFCCRQQNLNAETSKEMPKKMELLRCLSETEATIMKAIQLSDQEPNLIGDFTKTYILPLVESKHQDLKCIDHETFSRLLHGDYTDAVDRCVIVDCRYPYEFDGGHIKGALNVYTKEGILHEMLRNPSLAADANRRLIVVFHCEFSSERGPNLSRFLRNKDREANHDCYPRLHYPEIYLLEGGYKGFFENHKGLCEPEDYRPMLHKDHENDLRHFRAKSKSWNGDKSGRLSLRSGLKF